MLFPSAVISSHTSTPTPSEYMQNGVLITTAGAGSRKVPDRVVLLDVEIWGSGGNGGYGGSIPFPPLTFSGGGGGGGGYCKRVGRQVAPEDILGFNISSSSTICDFMTASSGQNGVNGSVSNGFGTGGSGGSGTGGDINETGVSGGDADPSQPGEGGKGGGDDGGAGGIFDGIAHPGTSPGGGGCGEITTPGMGAVGGVKFSWTEELLEDFENLIPPDNFPDGWGATAGVWGPDTINKTFGSQSLRGTSMPYSASIIYQIPNDWIGKYQKLKIDVRLDSSGEVKVEAFDNDFNNSETKTISTTWTTFEVSIANLSIDNYAIFWVQSNDGISCNIDNLRGVL